MVDLAHVGPGLMVQAGPGGARWADMCFLAVRTEHHVLPVVVVEG